MTGEQKMVEEFHRKFEIVFQHTPADPADDTKQLRIRSFKKSSTN